MTRSRRCAHLLPSVSLPFSLPTLPVSRITRLPALLCLFLLSSCYINVPYGGSSWHTVTGAGDVTSEVRPVGNIRSVNLDNQGDLIIRLGDSESLLVEAEENLLDYIVTEVRGDELHIYNDGNYFFRTHEPIRYYLTVKNLEGISAGSVGSVTAPDLSADRFQIRVGSTGSVSIDALRAGAVDIDVASTGNMVGKSVRRIFALTAPAVMTRWRFRVTWPTCGSTAQAPPTLPSTITWKRC